MDGKRVYVTVEGIVQGVGFRWFTRNRAFAHGVTGFVRNMHNGDVEAVIEGDEQSVRNMLMDIRQGPSSGRVDNVHVEWQDYRREFNSFSIRF